MLRKKQIAHHPDKNKGNEDESAKNFIKYTQAFHVIKTFRQFQDRWIGKIIEP